MNRIGAGLSTHPDTAVAVLEASRQAAGGLGGAGCDLAFLFLSQAHLDTAEAAMDALAGELAPLHTVGCVAQGILGRELEVEEQPAVAVWAGSLPGARIEPFHAETLVDGETVELAGLPSLDGAKLVTVLADPFSFLTGALLERLNDDAPGLPLVGGVAIGSSRPGRQALIADGELYSEGAVGVVFGNVSVVPVVSQGCRPIGRTSVVTSAEDNVVYELAGQPALERLHDEIATLPPSEQLLAAQGILAGVVIDENLPEYRRGDFLMRGLLGADEDTGALLLGDEVRVGQTVQFHVRDARSADDDLRESLARALGNGARAAGALLFTCNGRGSQMFAEASHDARVVTELLGSFGVAGFFCGGEIGPVGSRTFLHGFTATMAVFLR